MSRWEGVDPDVSIWDGYWGCFSVSRKHSGWRLECFHDGKMCGMML
jgi:hypothetical protein